jgi:predicted chitinase
MTVHLAQLIAAGITPAVARVFLPHLLLAADRFTINTPRRMAAFIGQCGHESSAFTRLEENLYYTDPARIARMFNVLRQVERARAYVGHPRIPDKGVRVSWRRDVDKHRHERRHRTRNGHQQVDSMGVDRQGGGRRHQQCRHWS